VSPAAAGASPTAAPAAQPAQPERNAYVPDDGDKKSDAQRQIEKVDGRSHLQALVQKHAEAQGVPASLAHAIVTIESRYNPRVTGSAGEVGLMQIKPSTARGLGYKGTTKALYDPETNIAWGMRYLAKAYELGDGDTCGTVLRYNAGHYAKRMNPISRRYCARVKAMLG
jgi:soluble lytic murein transglycosylase-like protein